MITNPCCSVCWDVTLSNQPKDEQWEWLMENQIMMLCPMCGNKRCPKAYWHEYKCTNSNAKGQAGELDIP